MIYQKYFKRPLDLIIAFIAMIVLTPLFIIIAILIRTKLGKPVIFQQKRPGLNGEIFTLYKFRSMTTKRDENGLLLPDEMRLTKFGNFLRNTSIDELPEIVNILKGDMSFIGPRPLLVEYLPLYNENQKHRHDVRPGLSGLAQVSGRNALSWEEKFDLDLKYVRNISFTNDFKILLLTFKKVFLKEDINPEGSAAVEDFKGSK